MACLSGVVGRICGGKQGADSQRIVKKEGSFKV
eukprot:CAMPEP_0115339758 /NCGR_PEP_ID=MMETSP0270-20121206/90788_1 /TAXON_ID=71861 /ORGANISM="Scrippsiella trochoidea, Strain CCMP3099" /LENGTH=32 /DNA_ID= /DNA_START= /DNA_END= /DNA_ORIENTATION=